MLERSPSTIDDPLRDLVEDSRFREALSLFLEWSESSIELTPDSQLLAAHAATRIGEFGLATRLAGMAQPEFRALGNEIAVIDCANLLGAVAFLQGNIEEAETQFRSVMQLAERAGCLRFIARAGNNLANVAHLRGQQDLAAAYYRRALDAYQGIGHERGIIETLHNLALSHAEAGRFDEALCASARAVDAAERLGAGGLVALTLLGRAELLIASEEFEQATADLERARLLAWLEGSEPHVLESERLAALLALRRGSPDQAHVRAEQVRIRATDAGCALIAAESATIAALALKADRRLREAAVANDLAVASLVALGAAGRLESHARAWRETAA